MMVSGFRCPFFALWAAQGKQVAGYELRVARCAVYVIPNLIPAPRNA